MIFVDTESMTNGYELNIIEVIPNNALTVYNVIWDLAIGMSNNKKISKISQKSEYDATFEVIQKNLNKVSKLIL